MLPIDTRYQVTEEGLAVEWSLPNGVVATARANQDIHSIVETIANGLNQSGTSLKNLVVIK